MQGIAAVDAPIALQMEKNGRMIDVQPNRIRKADPRLALAGSALRGWLGSMLGEEEEKIKELPPQDHYHVLQVPVRLSLSVSHTACSVFE